jgi:ATP-dependent protease ClpP protease subunit
MKLLHAALALLLAASPVLAWDAPAPKKEVEVDKSVKEVRWQDACDMDMLKAAREDISSARNDKDVKTLRVSIMSPGGPVITCLEIARLVREASKAGLVVEVHAQAFCASGCTFILAAGTPGKRFIGAGAFYLVHPPQAGGFGSAECVAHVAEPKTVEDKVKNTLLDMLRDRYVEYSGRPAKEVEEWLTCEHERVGLGALAVAMGLADATE